MSKFTISDENIRQIFHNLCELTLPKSDWTHDAHLAAAVAILSDPRFKALKDMPQIIKNYNEATGVPNTDNDGYHHTITIASLYAVKSILNEGDPTLSETFHKLLNSEFGRSKWPLSYWSSDRLFSSSARKTWVEPDLKKLPFKTHSDHDPLNEGTSKIT